MATVHLVYPADPGTYGTNADGTLVPFTATGYVDAPGQVVSLYDDGAGTLLGTVAADVTPEPSGDWAGWYGWAITVYSWTGSPGLNVPAAAANATGGGVGQAGALTVPAAEATTEGGDITQGAATLYYAPAAMATSAGGSILIATALDVPYAAATSSAGDVSISSAPAGSVLDTFDDSSINTSIWEVIQASGTVSEGSYLTLATTDHTHTAALKWKTPIVRGTTEKVIKIDMSITAVNGGVYHDYWSHLLYTADQSAPSYGVRATFSDLNDTEKIQTKYMYTDANYYPLAGDYSADPALGATVRLRYDITTTTIRLRVMSTDEATTYADSGTVNWTNVYGNSGENLDLYIGDWNSGWGRTDMRVYRFEAA